MILMSEIYSNISLSSTTIDVCVDTPIHAIPYDHMIQEKELLEVGERHDRKSLDIFVW